MPEDNLHGNSPFTFYSDSAFCRYYDVYLHKTFKNKYSLTRHQALLLSVIQFFTELDGKKCYASSKKIGAYLGKDHSKKTTKTYVSREINVLREYGYIVRVKEATYNFPAVYELSPKAIEFNNLSQGRYLPIFFNILKLTDFYAGIVFGLVAVMSTTKGDCSMSVSDMCKKLRISESIISSKIELLKDKGLLISLGRPFGPKRYEKLQLSDQYHKIIDSWDNEIPF